jgi:protein-S-isoprenylcysteine O-methyltransferase Ste14
MNIIDIFVIISLVIFYVLFLGRTIILYKKGIKVWAIGTSTKKLFEIILENILFPALVFWTVFVILVAFRVNLPTIISNYLINVVLLKYIGIILCSIGLIIFLMALISFGKSWRIGIDENNSNELVTTGMFKYSRNPIFLFIDLYFTGIMLIYPNIIFIIIAVCTLIGIHLQILREEKFLLKRFGEEYIEYKKQTRRYI